MNAPPVHPRLYVTPERGWAKGTEWWSDKFQYPNGWSLSSLKKVVVIETEKSWNLVRATDVDNKAVIVLTFFVLLVFVRIYFFYSGEDYGQVL